MKHNFILNFSKYLLISFPILLISGPFLTDFSGSLIGVLMIFYIVKNKKYEYLNNRFFYFFAILFFYINLTSFFSEDPFTSFKSSVTYVRLIFFIFGIAFLINYYEDLPLRIYQIYFACLFILFLDSLLIINFNINIFGMQSDGTGARMRSLFDDEEIMGSFVSRTVPLIIGITYYLNHEKISKYNIIMLMIAFSLILISGERTALGNFFIFLFFYFLLERKKFLLMSFILTLIIIIIFQIKQESINRVINHTISQSNINSNKIIFFSLRHTLHYFTAYEIFKDNPVFGAGIKSFRKLCFNKDYVEKMKSVYGKDMKKLGLNDGCNTHPHHIYMQFLSEIGIIGFLLFLSIFIYITYNLFVLFRNSLSNSLNNREKVIYFCLVAVFISMFPFLPSGNYFNNWFIFINYFPIGFYLANKITK